MCTLAALKKAILHRKNVLFYKTQNGAAVGDLFMSLIHTAERQSASSIGRRTGGAADLCTLAERTPLIGTLALELRRTPRPLRAGNDLRGGRAWVREQRRSWNFPTDPEAARRTSLLIGRRKMRISLKVELRPTRAPRACVPRGGGAPSSFPLRSMNDRPVR